MGTVVMNRATSGWSLGVGAVLLLSAVVLGVSLGSLPDGADGANAANYALSTVMFLGPLVAGLTGTLTGQDARDKQHELASSTARGRFGGVLVNVLSGVLWGGAAHLGVLVAALTRGTNFVMRPADASLVVAAWALLLACSVAGAWIGVWRSSPHAGLWAAGICFVLVYGGGYLEEWTARAATVYPGTAFPIFMEPNAPMILGKSLLVSTVAVLGLAAFTRPRRGRRAVSALVAIAAVSAGVVMIRGGPDLPAVPTATHDPVCSQQDSFTVCAWPQHAGRSAQALEALGVLQSTIGHVYPLPKTYREDGAGPAAPGDVLMGSLPDPDHPGGTGELGARLALLTIPQGPCPDGAATQAKFDLTQWLYQATSSFSEPPSTSDAEVRRLVEESQRCDA